MRRISQFDLRGHVPIIILALAALVLFVGGSLAFGREPLKVVNQRITVESPTLDEDQYFEFKGMRERHLPLSTIDYWAEVNSTGQIVRAHAVLRDADGNVVQEGFYNPAGGLTTTTIYDGHEALHNPSNLGKLFMPLDTTGTLDAPGGIGQQKEWVEVQSLNDSVREFEMKREGKSRRLTFDRASERIMEEAVYSSQTASDESLLMRITYEMPTISASASVPSSAWDSVLEKKGSE